jgi:ABC-type Mn2+/Zn2+ transport system ATPase subunit
VVRLFGEDVRRFRDWWMVGYLPQQAATFFEKMALSVEELLSAARGQRPWNGAGGCG